MREFVHGFDLDAGFSEAIPNRINRKRARVFVAAKALLRRSRHDLPVHNERRGGIVPLRDVVFALGEPRPFRLFKGYGIGQSAKSLRCFIFSLPLAQHYVASITPVQV